VTRLSDQSERRPRSQLTFKVATEDREFEQIHRLNHRTFVDEIPQHAAREDGLLVDRFHEENTYFLCLDGEQLVGMVAARGNRPFSLDSKLEDLDRYLPDGVSVCEIRLLAIERERRKGRIIQGLLTNLAHYCIGMGYDAAIISGNIHEERLYRRLGFVPFGPRVGTPEASYQPMIMDRDQIAAKWPAYLSEDVSGKSTGESRNMLPGPVTVSSEVQRAFARPPVSHRSPAFVADVGRIKERLCDLVGAHGVEILMGSGTVANDAVAGQLSLAPGRGLVLSNGEFGDRLKDHGLRAGLDFDTIDVEWGQPLVREDLEVALAIGNAEWLWAVHCETSTGVLNDLSMIKETCAQGGIQLAMDCISSVGTMPLDLAGVSLASCVSGKGLGAYPGLSMVFHEGDLTPAPDKLPRYLDLGLYAARDGIPYTISTNLVYALDAAIRDLDADAVLHSIDAAANRLRAGLRRMGCNIVAKDEHSTPAVTTIVLPPGVDSIDVGRRLEDLGLLISYNSNYLHDRNWIQVCLMGPPATEGVGPLLDALQHVLPVQQG
jgi:aspartate aminotransferase-like enzyme